MKLLAKWAGYIALGAVAYIMFMYWTFPYDQLKNRLESGIEQALGADYDVTIGSMSPSFVTGAVLKDVKINLRSGAELKLVLQADKARVRVGLFSLLLGNPSVSFSLLMKKSTIDGSISKRDNGFVATVELDPLLFSSVDWFSSKLGLKLDGKMKGQIAVNLGSDASRGSDGSIDIKFQNGELAAGTKISLGAAGSMELTNPIRFAQDSDSKLDVKWGKGLVQLNEWKWSGGDLQVNLKGQIFTGNTMSNYRLNVNGSVTLSPQFEKDFPIVALIAKQKQADGSYAIAVTGNMDHPAIKIGDFPLPL